jgi:hypothetical protein
MSDAAPATSVQGVQAKRLAAAVAEFKRDGFVVLERAIPSDLVEALRSDYMRLLEAKVERFNIRSATRPDAERYPYGAKFPIFLPEGGNHDYNRWNMHVPSRRPFLDDRVIAHPDLVGILEDVTRGDGENAPLTLGLLASDTPFPGATDQGVHADGWNQYMFVNLALVDIDESNSPTEVWPSTHLTADGRFTTESIHRTVDEVAEATRRIASRKICMPAGSFLIRDTRLLHRGTAHHGTAPRPVLSLGYGRLHDVTLPRGVTNLAARWTSFLRRQGRRNGAIDVDLLNFGNLLGRTVTGYAMTDRYGEREIPPELWRDLSPTAQRLLRLAAPGEKSAVSHLHSARYLGLLLSTAPLAATLLAKSHLLGPRRKWALWPRVGRFVERVREEDSHSENVG